MMKIKNDMISVKYTNITGTKWTIDEDNKLVQEIAEKKTYEEIASEHKRTITSIQSRVITNIIYPKYENENDIDIVKISKEYNIDSKTILKYINKLQIDNDTKLYQLKTKTIIEYLQKMDRKMEEINNKLDKLLNI